jgi:hypothetical protein
LEPENSRDERSQVSRNHFRSNPARRDAVEVRVSIFFRATPLVFVARASYAHSKLLLAPSWRKGLGVARRRRGGQGSFCHVPQCRGDYVDAHTLNRSQFMRHALRVGAVQVPLIASFAFCAASIAVIAVRHLPARNDLRDNYDHVISANVKLPPAAVANRATIIESMVETFSAEIGEAVNTARPADGIESARYARFMDAFKAELRDGLRAHLDSYTDAELYSLTKPQWDLVASDLEIGARFREWITDSAPQIVDRVYAELQSPRHTAQREKIDGPQSVRPGSLRHKLAFAQAQLLDPTTVRRGTAKKLALSRRTQPLGPMAGRLPLSADD